jgi:hypothetical protein
MSKFNITNVTIHSNIPLIMTADVWYDDVLVLQIQQGEFNIIEKDVYCQIQNWISTLPPYVYQNIEFEQTIESYIYNMIMEKV